MIELLRKRRSIRKYKDKKIETKKLTILQEAVLRSPSSRNFKPWRFIFIQDRNILKKLATAKPKGGSFITTAPLAVVICGNPTRSDVWVEDCSIAAIILQLTAESLGLGSCWIQIRKRLREDKTPAGAYIKTLLDLPDQFEIEAIISIGYPAENPSPINFSDLDHEKVSFH